MSSRAVEIDDERARRVVLKLRATRAHLSARPHLRQHAVVFDDPIVKRPRDMQRDDRRDQYAADEMPDEDPVRKQHILGGDRGKGEEPENAKGITIGVGAC
jgi:hypothetical protein